MGTGAPEGSPWHQILKAMGEKWKESSGGAVTLRIYPGGVLGDEPDLVRKMRVGQIQAAAVTVPFGLKFIQGNQVKGLAVLAESRDTLLPDVSTSAEQGLPDLIASIYNVLFVPAKTPAPIVKQLEDTLRRTLQDQELVDSLEKMQFKIDFLNSADTQVFLDNEVKKWAAVIKRAHITAQ